MNAETQLFHSNEFPKNTLTDAVTIEDVEQEGEETYMALLYGSKRIELTFLGQSNSFETDISTIEGNERKPNETTIIYSKAKEIMQAKADELGIPITYKSMPRSPQLQKWAQTKGHDLFEWDSIEPNHFYHKIFYPRSKK